MDSQKLTITLQEPHVHLTKRMVWALFGEGAKLTPKAPADMPGKFLAQETVTVVGPAGEIELSVLGPSAVKTQVELTPALAAQLGVAAKVEASGEGSAGGVLLRGPAGEAALSAGVLIPRPHIHMPPEDASTLSLMDGQSVTLKTPDGRTLDHVLVRVSHLTANRIHILKEEGTPFTGEDTFSLAN